MSRIQEALKKAQKEQAEFNQRGGLAATGSIASQVIEYSARDQEKIKKELEKQGLIYTISPEVVSYHSPKSTIAEEYRIMRTNFLSMSNEGKSKRQIKSIVISSVNRKEGKSVTALNFAFALPQNGRTRVLLVDCDFRRPAIGKMLGIRPKHDMISVLTKDVPLQKAIVPTPQPGLDVIVVNKISLNPAELIGSSKMKRVIASLRAMYDVVIYDSPPIMAVTDAVVLGAEADGIIMAVQARNTQRERIRDAEDLLHQAHAILLGFVLTGVRTYIPKYFKQYQYYTTYQYVD